MLLEEEVSRTETDGTFAPEEKRLSFKNSRIITLLVCTAVSMLLLKTGIFSLFFLAPLGYAVILTGAYLPVFITASAANIVIIFVQSFSAVDGMKNMPIEALYLTAVLFGFAWIMGGKGIRTVYRFVIASLVCAGLFLIFINSPSSGFYEFFTKMAEELFGGNSEINKNPLLSQKFSPQALTEFAKIFLLRGGAVVSMFFLFFINRQIAVNIVSMIKRQRINGGLTAFYAPANTIWALSCALATIVLSGIFTMEILGILAWNVFVVCVIIFMAQGIGIFSYWMSLRSNAFKLIISILIVAILFSPLNSFVLAALIFLGIIDNWRPFRVAKSVR